MIEFTVVSLGFGLLGAILAVLMKIANTQQRIAKAHENKPKKKKRSV